MSQSRKITQAYALDDLLPYIKDLNQDTQPRKYYPLAKWQPTEFGEMDLTIKANGEWWHEGSKITRKSLVSLFSSLLWCEEAQEPKATKNYFLKTPVQKIKIKVEDAPLLISSVDVIQSENPQNYVLEFTTNTQDIVSLTTKNQIYFSEYQGDMRPYIQVRDNLHALISRNVFYHLIEIGTVNEENGNTVLTLKSADELINIICTE